MCSCWACDAPIEPTTWKAASSRTWTTAGTCRRYGREPTTASPPGGRPAYSPGSRPLGVGPDVDVGDVHGDLAGRARGRAGGDRLHRELHGLVRDRGATHGGPADAVDGEQQPG